MSASVVVPWDDALIGYDLGPGHPLNPLRLDLTMRLARELGVLDLPPVTMTRPEPAGDDLLELRQDRPVHQDLPLALPLPPPQYSHAPRPLQQPSPP
jgi:hypothetical protein